MQEVGGKGTWGDSYFIVKAGTAVRADHPAGQQIGGQSYPVGVAGTLDANRNLLVRIAYRKGSKYTTTWIDGGDNAPPVLLTASDGEADANYEYEMYGIARKLYPSCPSAWMAFVSPARE